MPNFTALLILAATAGADSDVAALRGAPATVHTIVNRFNKQFNSIYKNSRHAAITSEIPIIDFSIHNEDRKMVENHKSTLMSDDIIQDSGFTQADFEIANDDVVSGNVCTVGCEGDYSKVHEALETLWNDQRKEYELFFVPRGKYAVAAGVIYTNFESRVRDLQDNYPDVDTIILVNVPGSANDDAMIAGAKVVHDFGYSTCVPGDGTVSSGGTDFFTAGVNRYATPSGDGKDGAQLGIHSWSSGDCDVGSDYPADDPQHAPYLDFYDYIGITQDFYWETLSHGTPMYYIKEEEYAEKFPYLRQCAVSN